MCVYNKKSMYIYVCGSCLNKYINAVTWFSNKNSWLHLGISLFSHNSTWDCSFLVICDALDFRERERERWRVSDGPFSFIILWRGPSQMLKLCSVTKYWDWCWVFLVFRYIYIYIYIYIYVLLHVGEKH